ncbi:hypothetical protein TVAG_247220 [Trichomonas vaginalis G3]|uniref:DUF1963 domain-containing protein n=1 Tax=Trichomonas vaginalis (strain ATCC PRA-98 / G3) TaxID=412133 RepID=A2DKR0_TRIV3|nr:protein of unknown function (DUF1963) [Trichomonas vaginalis G3]EAY19043.1 hypothetical protein TVAG_247220 [Trichomonas vaginalis G3]KAI5521163.1 protein of unknown function (DUF1963) [Trichomonas vaginalis G3]|eukprot:XP_001580029.1 hypothetical protein [Trichomonas vaginalis G3]
MSHLEGLNQEQLGAIEWFGKKGFTKKGIFIRCEKAEATKAALSKYGGKVPHLPGEDPSVKTEDGVQLELAVQLYVPELPENVQRLLPQELQDALILLFINTEDSPENGPMPVRIYHKDDISKLELADAKEDAHIESAIFKSYEVIDTYNDSGNDFLESMEEVDGLVVEELMHEIRSKRDTNCYFGGFPYFVQGEASPGEGWTLLLNLQDDSYFSYMFGDAGTAQIWVNDSDPTQFDLEWQCG